MATPIGTKPYLVRAIHLWCLEQGYTPYLTVSVGAATRVPREYVKDGQIVLNLGPEATHQLVMDNEAISFTARFSGVAQSLYIPMGAVAAIYARENGQGMAFDVEPDHSGAAEAPASADEPPAPPAPPVGRSHLTRIK